MAEAGAPEGTVLIAREQTAGKGRMGRSFYSAKDDGLYLSCLLRPNCPPTELMHLTCAVGVAVCSAVEDATGIKPQIKWINDLVLDNKKLGGILTELSIHPGTGLVDYAIIGIGINCLQECFPEELSSIATSLLLSTGKVFSPAHIAGCIMTRLETISHTLYDHKNGWLDSYRTLCVTLGKEVKVQCGDTAYTATARDVGNDGSLLVILPDGTERVVYSGEASVRGLYGYL